MTDSWNVPADEEDIDGRVGSRTKEALFGHLAANQYDHKNPPNPPFPILKLGETTISTPGNITTLQSGPKTGKSTAVAAAMASTMVDGELEVLGAPNRPANSEPDTLGFESGNPDGLAVIHFDSEQSSFDHDALVRRAIKRANISGPPEWFHSYLLTNLDFQSRMTAIELALEKHLDEYNSILMVIIDGIADLIEDPNNATEANSLVGKLHQWAILYNCSFLVVIHENPGSEYGKARGHLGSQLERKSETVLRLAKDSTTGITTVWSDKARHCPIPKSHGSCFCWNDDQELHVSCGGAAELKQDLDLAKSTSEVERIFTDKKSLTYGKLVDSIQKSVGVKNDAAKKRVRLYKELKLIKKTADERSAPYVACLHGSGDTSKHSSAC